MENVRLIKVHDADARSPSGFRFFMTASLGGSILILATLLARDLASIGLQDQQQAYAQSFRDAIGILHDLATYLRAARRVVDEFRDIVNVVTTILNQQQGIGNGQEGQPAPPTMFPANLDDLFSYGALDFAQQAGPSLTESGRGVGNGSQGKWSAGNSDLGGSAMNVDSWDLELQPAGVAGFGVPWI